MNRAIALHCASSRAASATSSPTRGGRRVCNPARGPPGGAPLDAAGHGPAGAPGCRRRRPP
eukprot:5496993-Lingulodinium_polyedra.AAC.1